MAQIKRKDVANIGWRWRDGSLARQTDRLRLLLGFQFVCHMIYSVDLMFNTK
jgi:hypothetical protein